MRTQQIAVYGAGGFGREVAWLAESCGTPEERCEVVCFVDDTAAHHGSVINDIPVMGLREARERFPDARLVTAVGGPALREQLAAQGAEAGFAFATLVHPDTRRSRWVEMGEGTVICAGNILTTNITLGRHVQINLDCTVGHDVVMGDFTTLAPGVHVSGWVHMGKRVYVGTGAAILNGSSDAPLVIGDDAVIGGAACVTRSVAPGTTVVGVPARPR
jgi:sugar O-acyltransferase (sialic acid O-acetyltransferase NeuD family)